MKTKKLLLTSLSLTFVFLFIITSNVSAEVNITSIEYPQAVEVGEVIDVTVYFEYTDPYSFFLCGPTADLFYSINSRTIAIDDFYVSTPVVGGSRPITLPFTLPTTALRDGDVLRFEIRYAVLEQNVAIEDRVTGIYKIDIGESEQVTTEETTTTTTNGGTNIPLNILIAIGAILALAVVVMGLFMYRKRR